MAFKVYAAARTVADCFRLRRRLGIEVAVEALRTGLAHEGCAAASRCRGRTPDGLEFDVASLRADPDRGRYGGKRVTLVARLGSGQLRVQVDVGIGNAVFPEPEWIDTPDAVGSHGYGRGVTQIVDIPP